MDEKPDVSEQRPRHDGVRSWLRKMFWYGVSIAAVLMMTAVALFVPVVLVGTLMGVLGALVPSLGTLRADWAILISGVISVILLWVFIGYDRRKWHTGERLRRLREGRGQDGPGKRGVS
jgi:hypothetical protein